MDAAHFVHGNREVLDELLVAIRRGRVTAMLGAGTSAPLYPLWGSLIGQLIEWSLSLGLADAETADTWKVEQEKAPEHVAQRIKESVGEARFRRKIAEIFALKRSGPLFTEAQRLIADVSFRAIVTTNYDPGIVEARIASTRADNPGFVSSSDHDSLCDWNSGNLDQFGRVPLLYAHGHVGQPESIVLTRDEYERLYTRGPFRSTFEHLWAFGPLLFIGFGFNDRWLELIRTLSLAEMDLTDEQRCRHFAFIPVHSATEATTELRALLRSRFGIEAIFYPSANGHEALLGILDRLPKLSLSSLEEGDGESKSHQEAPYTWGQEWVHETTNDRYYVDRNDEYDRLWKYAKDARTRVVGITGMGGQGKTSLIGSWLQNRKGSHSRRFEGLLYWSFYNDPSVEDFLGRLIQLVNENASGIGRPQRRAGLSGVKQEVTLVDVAIKAISSHCLLVILDGLEVLQESPTGNLSGQFLNDDLREFLTRACRQDTESLLLLTSRFVFRDLGQYEGLSFKELELPALSLNEGVGILRNMAVAGESDVLRQVVHELEGHPLALRLFVATLHAMGEPNPAHLLQRAFMGYQTTGLHGKIQRLISFYERHTPPDQIKILGAIALFSVPVPAEAALAIAARSSSRNVEDVSDGLERLIEAGLVLREVPQDRDLVSCHPVLRDHFRRGLLAEDSEPGEMAARYLTERPGEHVPTSIKSVAQIVLAMEILGEIEQFDLAHQLFERRLQGGKVFFDIPAFNHAFRATSVFVGSPTRLSKSTIQLGARSVRRLLIENCEFSSHIGDVDESVEQFAKAEDISSSRGAREHSAILRRNKARVLIERGELNSAASLLRSSAWLLPSDLQPTQHVLAAYIAALQGDGARASNELGLISEEDEYEFMSQPEYVASWLIYEAETYRYFEHYERSKAIQGKALDTAAGLGAEGLSLLPLISGAEIALAKSPSLKAIKMAVRAVTLARRSHNLLLLPKALNVYAGLLTQMNGNQEEALLALNESINLARSRGLALSLVTALQRKSSLLLRDASSEPEWLLADDLAEESISIAHDCSFHWGLVEGEILRAQAAQRLGKQLEAQRHRSFAESLSHRAKSEFSPPVPVQPSAPQLADLVEKLKRHPGFH